MIDLSEQEKVAIASAMKPVAELMAEIGWATRLNGLSEQQVLTLIECAVGGFQQAMHAMAGNDSTEVPW